jgi:hypothetical protein
MNIELDVFTNSKSKLKKHLKTLSEKYGKAVPTNLLNPMGAWLRAWDATCQIRVSIFPKTFCQFTHLHSSFHENEEV